MVRLLVLIASFGVTVIGAVLAARLASFRRWQRDLLTYELRFPFNLDPKAVTTFLGGLSGLAAPRPWHQLTVRALVIEVSATAQGIRHNLVLPRTQAGIVLAQLRAALPGATLQLDPAHRPTAPALAGSLGLRATLRSLAGDQPTAVARSLLASLQPLDGAEQLIIQLVLCPLGPVAPPARGS